MCKKRQGMILCIQYQKGFDRKKAGHGCDLGEIVYIMDLFEKNNWGTSLFLRTQLASQYSDARYISLHYQLIHITYVLFVENS